MRKQFQFTWWKYLIAILIPIILWCSVFDILAQPKKNQQLSILYVGSDLDTDSLRQQIVNTLPSLTDQSIKEISVDAVSPQNMDSLSVLTARTFEYDILIFQESSILPNMGQNVFWSLPDDLMSHFSGISPYREDTEAGSLPYGFLLCDGKTANSFSACYSGTETCYLFLSPKSENLDTLNQNGKKGDDAALRIAQYLLEITP